MSIDQGQIAPGRMKAAPAFEGGQPGRVDFEFRTSDSRSLFLVVSIEKYQREAKSLAGAQLFRLFYNNP